MENLLKDITKSVSILTEEWFKSKVEYFEKEPFYIKELKKVYERVDDFGYYQDYLGDLVTVETVIKLDIEIAEYSWNSMFYGSLSKEALSYEESDCDLPIDSKLISFRVAKLLKDYTKNFIEVKAIQTCISRVVQHLQECVKKVEHPNKGSQYIECLEYFSASTQKFIYEEFEYIQQQIDLIENPNHHLDFELTQESLAGLLFILKEADFLKPVKINKDGFLRFCSEFFCYKFKNEYVRPKSLKSFSDKYGKFVRGENSKLLSELKSKLLAVLQKI